MIIRISYGNIKYNSKLSDIPAVEYFKILCDPFYFNCGINNLNLDFQINQYKEYNKWFEVLT
jgi:hypothetical protein